MKAKPLTRSYAKVHACLHEIEFAHTQYTRVSADTRAWVITRRLDRALSVFRGAKIRHGWVAA